MLNKILLIKFSIFIIIMKLYKCVLWTFNLWEKTSRFKRLHQTFQTSTLWFELVFLVQLWYSDIYYFLCYQLWCMRWYSGTWRPSSSGCTLGVRSTTPSFEIWRTSSGSIRSPSNYARGWRTTSRQHGPSITALIPMR